MPGEMRFGLVLLASVMCLQPGCGQGARKPSPQGPPENVETVEQRWPDGTLRFRKQVLSTPEGEPVNHGPYMRWHKNGRKEYQAVFVHGKKSGTTTRWHMNGRKWVEQHYVSGRKHGLCRVWDENGVMRKEERYDDGKPDGTWTTWNKDGKVKWQGSFDHGRPGP